MDENYEFAGDGTVDLSNLPTITITYPMRVKPVTTAKKLPDEQQLRDTFQTPNYATELLIPFIPSKVKTIWECAAGKRKIADVLESHGYSVKATDIKESPRVDSYNFLSGEMLKFDSLEQISIISNPPFSIKEEFIERAFEYQVPFAFLINADYSGRQIAYIRRGCEKIIPTSRIAYITPNIVARVNEGEGTRYEDDRDIPSRLLYKYSAAQFHSMWLTYGFNIGRTETFVDLSVEARKSNV